MAATKKPKKRPTRKRQKQRTYHVPDKVLKERHQKLTQVCLERGIDIGI